MRWLAKAALQRGLGLLPQGERLNYVFQRRVLRSLPASESVFRRKFARALQHLRVYEEHGPGTPAAEACFYEFGAGWDLAIPLSYATLGVGRQVLVDIRPSVRIELVNESLAAFERLWGDLESEAGRELRPLGPPLGSVVELEERLGITYLAPRDARATGLPAESLDFVASTDTCEHIPADDLAAIFRESLRLLRTGGAFSCRIDLQDHYAYFDRGLSRYNFLRYSDRTWSLVNSPLHHQNRLRAPDYLRLVREAGFELVADLPSGPSEEGLAELRELPLAPRFRGYTPEELGVTILSFVARRPA
ncbi:MAG: class I SAM-dependent methyltransferase [Actinomycetota bacterium]|nr:class I SAM-dependent methyltransferase [Actinomycetota bacterium]